MTRFPKLPQFRAAIDAELANLATRRATLVQREMKATAAQDRDERGASAKRLIGIASAVDAAAADLDRALEQAGKACAAPVAAVPDTLAVVEPDGRIGSDGSPMEGRDDASPNDLARAILAEGIARFCPGAMAAKGGFPWGRLDRSRAEDLAGPRPAFVIDNVAAVPTPVTARTAAAAGLVGDRAPGFGRSPDRRKADRREVADRRRIPADDAFNSRRRPRRP